MSTKINLTYMYITQKYTTNKIKKINLPQTRTKKSNQTVQDKQDQKLHLQHIKNLSININISIILNIYITQKKFKSFS